MYTSPIEIIMDMSQEETETLYAVLRNLFDYPAIEDENEELDSEGLEYEIAFAFLCEEYLKSIQDYSAHEDFGLLLHDCGLSEVYEMDDLSDEFKEKIWEQIETKKSKICQDISAVFTSEELQLRLFGILSYKGNGSYSGALGFVQENFRTMSINR